MLAWVVAWLLALWQPPWQRAEHTSAFTNHQPQIEAVLRSRLVFSEQFPQLLRRTGHHTETGTGWKRDHYFGDSAMGSGLTLELRQVAAGWPLLALTGEHRWVRNASFQQHNYAAAIPFGSPTPASLPATTPFTLFPLAPVLPGFLLNSLLFAVVLAALHAALAQARRALRRRAGRCIRCGYPTGNSDVCTECGFELLHRPHRLVA